MRGWGVRGEKHPGTQTGTRDGVNGAKRIEYELSPCSMHTNANKMIAIHAAAASCLQTAKARSLCDIQEAFAQPVSLRLRLSIGGISYAGGCSL